MNRRGFLGSLAALCVAPLVPTPKPAPKSIKIYPEVAFHKDAFAMVMAPLPPYRTRRVWVFNPRDQSRGEWMTIPE